MTRSFIKVIKQEIYFAPCPACGTDPDLCEERSDRNDYHFTIWLCCPNCGISSRKYGYSTSFRVNEKVDTAEILAKDWNKYTERK